MLTGEQIREARKRARLSQAELAKAVGVSMRSVGGWERGENAPNIAEARLREVLGPYLSTPESTEGMPILTRASDAQLLAEIARRFARSTEAKAGEGDGSQASTQKSDEVARRRTEREARRPLPDLDETDPTAPTHVEQISARKGESTGRRARKEQDEAEMGSQDDGGMDPA